MRIRAFMALRPEAELAPAVASVPYDVVNTDEARRLAAGNPHCFLHISRAEIDLPAGTDPHSDAVYGQAAAAFARFQKAGVLVRDTRPALFVYRQQMGNHAQSGVVACCHIEDYEQNLIRQHEKTLLAKENDRARHIRELNAQAGPVFLVYRDNAAIDRIVADLEKTRPAFDFVAPDGVRHSAWQIQNCHEMETAFAGVTRSYIADGHHRFAAAVKVGRERRDANPSHSGNEEYNWVLGVFFPASQLSILPYNRVVRDLNNMRPDEFVARVQRVFSIREVTTGIPDGPDTVNMYMARKWYDLKWKPEERTDGPGILDVSILQDRLLAPVLGIDDPRTSKRIEFIGGTNAVRALVERVDSGGGAVAFSLRPVAIGDVMAYSDAGLVMPPKSTWFEPKLRSGLFIHTL
ncbi:MAG: DUF1015 family protein [bacterium]